MFLVTSDEMRRVDQTTIEQRGIPSQTLMENAGRRVFEELESHFSEKQKRRIIVVVGKGNNGGDGLVVARLLKEKGRQVQVLRVLPELDYSKEDLSAATLIVDGIFGTGLSHEVRGSVADVIRDMNRRSAAGIPVVAIDVPSGLSSDTGRPLGVAVKATLTVTLATPKIGLIQPDAEPYVGELKIVGIGIPDDVYQELGIQTHWVTSQDIAPLFKVRTRNSHKGTYGHVLLVGGSANKPGAILLSGRAALRTGSGLVTVALPDKAFRKFPKNFLELMYEPMPSTKTGLLSARSGRKILALLKDMKSAAIGPGMGVSRDTISLVSSLRRSSPVPLVIDADGLNCLAKDRKGLKDKAPVILTPHPGEMARLVGTSIAKVNQNRIGVARDFARAHGAVVILKGHQTVTAHPNGHVFVNSTGNPGMATAGMGDVLTGIIVSLLGQGLSPEDASRAGVYLHGRAGDRVAERLGDRGLLATDMMDEIPLVIKELLL